MRLFNKVMDSNGIPTGVGGAPAPQAPAPEAAVMKELAGQMQPGAPAGGAGAMATGPMRPAGVQPASEVKAIIEGEGHRRVIRNLEENAGMAELLATMAEENGYYAQAASIRGQEMETGLTAGFKHSMEHHIKVKDVVFVLVGAAILFVVYEGLAYKFDLPRVGVFDPKDAKSLRK